MSRPSRGLDSSPMRHTTTTYYGWQRDAPRFVRRFYWRMIPLPLPLGVALFTAPLLKPGVLPPFGFWSFTAVMFVVVVLAVLWAWAMSLWEKRFVQRLRAAAYRLCPQCGFVLTGHEGSFNCPECGEACDLDKIQAAWRSFRPKFTAAND